MLVFAVYGFFIEGVFSWTRGVAAGTLSDAHAADRRGFIFNVPRLISAIAPLIAGSLIVGLGGYGKTASIIGLFYILGLVAVPFLPETKGKPLSEADTLAALEANHKIAADRHDLRAPRSVALAAKSDKAAPEADARHEAGHLNSRSVPLRWIRPRRP